MGNTQNNFIEREQGEPLALHLFRNADVIGCDVDQRRRLRHAAQLCVRGNQAPYSRTAEGRADRIEAGRIAHEVQVQLKASAADVAAAQGEKVEAFNDAGALRVKGRDGLWSAVSAGDITQAAAETGLAYRLLFETAGASQLGSQLGRVDEAAVKAATSHGAAARGLFRAYAGVRLTTAEALVLKADPTQRALRVLRAVAGEGRTIRSLGGGVPRKLNATALGLALDVMEPVLMLGRRSQAPCESRTD